MLDPPSPPNSNLKTNINAEQNKTFVKLTLPSHHLSFFFLKKPSYKGSLYYNDLPELWRHQEAHFKKHLKMRLQDQLFYPEAAEAGLLHTSTRQT